MIDGDSSRICFGDDFARVLKVTAARTALKRLPELEEIASVAALLCTRRPATARRRPSRWTAG
jgi:hypothetical protein